MLKHYWKSFWYDTIHYITALLIIITIINEHFLFVYEHTHSAAHVEVSLQPVGITSLGSPHSRLSSKPFEC